MANDPILEVDGLRKSFPTRLGTVEAVRGVSFALRRTEILGLVGETGCGKSTVVRCIAGLTRPSAGSVRLDGEELTTLSSKRWRAVRRRLQVVFQNPYLSLDPRIPVLEIVREPLSIHHLGSRSETAAVSAAVLESVGIGAAELAKRPGQLSGGQRQRVAIARALVLEPEVLLLDEPVSALDVSVQAQVINLLMDLRQQHLSCLVVLHDLSVASQLCDRIAVIYLGRIVEEGPTEEVLSHPRHPYTQGLLDSVPRLGAGVSALGGSRPLRGDAAASPEERRGCRFRDRCPRYQDAEICRAEEPELRPIGPQQVACHKADEPAPAVVSGSEPQVPEEQMPGGKG